MSLQLENLEEYRIRSSRLLRMVRGSDPAAALEAARRFQRLPMWRDQTPEQLLETRESIRRKHALAVIAIEAGFRDWLGLREAVARTPVEGPFDTARLFPPKTSSYLNLWLKQYAEAKEVLQARPERFLFPYGQHFVICEPGLLEDLGVDISDPDWDRIGHDWVKPDDPAAQARLSEVLRRVVT